MGKSKWYNWLLNPIGAAVNNLTSNAKKGGIGDAINHIVNPIKNFTDSALWNKQYKKELVQQDIEDMAKKAGMSLEEFLTLNPDYAKSYESGSTDSIIDIVSENEHIDSLIKNYTGERDTAENEKNRLFQHDEAEINRQWEAEQAKAAREWDSIGAQMERAAAAGVNPISIAMQNGGINSSATTSIPAAPGYPSGSAGLMHNGALDIASMIFQGIGTLAENRLKQTQADDITIMRKYNIAEKIANTDHLRELCKGVNLSNVAQTIQNRWLDAMNQATYDNMLLDKGVKRSNILKERSVADLNVQQVAQIKQSMEMALKEFNAKLPLELQLMESELNLKNQTVQDVYYECCLRYLQMFEQENRNRQSAAEAEGAEIETSVARETMEDAITQFHNSMVKAAAEAGISLYDYMYYGYSYSGAFDFMGKAQRRAGRNKKGYYQNVDWNRNQIILPAQTAQPMQ